MLTPQQHKTLKYIRSYLERSPHGPTIQEIGDAIGVKSKGAVHRLVMALESKGYLERSPRSWRGLRPVCDSGENTLPLLGRIAAGRPIEAIPGEDEINVVEMLLGPRRFALRVKGDSMIGAGILDGDTVIVKQSETAADGDIVVALIDHEEATLKRLKRRADGTIELIAANPQIPSMVFAAERVVIQGIVVGQFRTY